MAIRIGLSGWSYEAWRGSFYPDDLPRKEELRHTAETFDTLEVNRTFYSLVGPGAFSEWYRATPPGFRWAVKGSRFITHNKRLRDVETPLANFFASGVLTLAEKLGPILWQLPPRMAFDRDRVNDFLELLPSNVDQARRLASGHDSRVEAKIPRGGPNRRLRHALEPRHPSFFSKEMVDLARDHGVALVFSHSSEWPYTEELTAGFVYLRMHGPGKPYASSYRRQISRWTDRVMAWSRGEEPEDPERITDRKPPRRKSRDVYVYFDNDVDAHAPHDAQALKEQLASR